MPDAYAEELATRLRALIEEFSARDADKAGQMYALTIAFYPSFYYGED